ncbi:hypothetical protein [Streptomyces sp. NPDC023588]|uniref:hypothetical protein n=1 Tax=Streptomyces sp. NPDC023588 TaxID=3154907 RepID=UPI0033D51DEB
MLVLRLRPRAFPVDGAGGDGGRDLFEYAEKGELINYEVKSFTGRMTPGRRNQVRDSLISTARHQPDHWDLLVPIDANPAEITWFEGLRAEFPFVRHWRGLGWLNTHFAAHPDLVRYSLFSSSDEILRMISESRAERDALMRGAPDFAERLAALTQLAQEVSPHYSLRPSAAADGTPAIEIVPKTRHIPPEDLITLTGRVSFRDDDTDHALLKDQFEQAVRFGGESVQLTAEHLRDFTVSAPAELGISGTVPHSLSIEAERQPIDTPLRASVVVRNGSGIPVASLPLSFTERSTGTSGGCLYGTDAPGTFKARLRLDYPASRTQFKMTFVPPDQALPSVYAPALRMMSRMLPGYALELAMPGIQASAPVPEAGGLMPPDEARQWADAFDDLTRLQSQTGHFFPVPDGFTLGDAHEVKEMLALLNGERVPLQASTVSVNVISREAFDYLAADGRYRLAARYDQAAHVFGDERIDLGPVVDLIYAERILNLPQALRQFDQTGQATVRLQMSKDIASVRYLGSELPD